MEQNQFERWKKLRSRGAFFFIAVYGLLWGIFMMILMSLFQFLLGTFSPGKEIESFFEPMNLAVYFGLFLVIAFIWATINWFVNERKFKQKSGE